MTLTQQPQPVRSSLLFSPVSTDSSASTPSGEGEVDLANSNISSSTVGTNGTAATSSADFKQHHRRRSDFRSKSTDQIIPNPVNPTNPIMSSTTLYPGPTSNKFSNVNVSQPALRAAPLAPIPIPATRFDTITSYVDVIYQQQQQLQQQNHQLEQNQNDQEFDDNQEMPRFSNQNGDDGIVYLDPSDGIEGDKSFMATCPQCAMMVMTEIDPFPGRKSRRMAILLSPLLLCWLPFYSSKIGKKWMDVKHSCPKCQSLIAIYRK